METTPSYLVETYGINPQHALDECFPEHDTDRYQAQHKMLADHPYYKAGKFE